MSRPCAVVFGLAIVAVLFRSATYWHELPNTQSYWRGVESQSEPKDNIQRARIKLLQGKVTQANRILYDEWNATPADKEASKSVEIGTKLSGAYLAHGSFWHAAQFYETLLANPAIQSNSARAALLNNESIAFYLAATASKDQTEAKKYFAGAMDKSNAALKILHHEHRGCGITTTCPVCSNQRYFLRDII